MTCSHIRDLLTTSLDEPVAPSQQTEVDAHVAECPACVGWMKEQVLTVQILRGLRAVEEAETVPPLPESLIERIMAQRKAAATRSNESRRTG